MLRHSGLVDAPAGAILNSATPPTPGDNIAVQHRALWVAVAIAYAALASRLTPLTWPSMLATVPAAAVVYRVGMRGRPVRECPAVVLERSRLVPWVVVISLGIGLEIAALLQTPREEFPTLSSFVSPLVGDSAGWYRFVGYLVWLGMGAWLARR